MGTFNPKVLVDTCMNKARDPRRVILTVDRINRVDLIVIVIFET